MHIGRACAFALLVACSPAGSGVMLGEAAGPRTVDTQSKDAKIFVSGSLPSVIYVLNAKGQIVSTLTDDLDIPQGLAVDRSGDLYVANLDADDIVVFSPPYTSSPRIIGGEPGASPLDVAVDAGGDLAVTNLATTSGNGDVALYAVGATSPTKILSSPAFQQPRYCAFDKEGNLFLDNIQSSASTWTKSTAAKPKDRAESVTIGEIRGGVKGRTITQLTTSTKIDNDEAGSVQVTSGGQIVIDDYVTPGGSGGNLYIFSAPKHNDLGTPTIVHLTGSIQPTTFALFAGGKRLITADYSLDAAQEFSYPAGNLLRTFHFPSGQLLQGVAVYLNPQRPGV